MWLETLLCFKEFFLYTFFSLIIWYTLYRRGAFNTVGRIKHYLLVGIGIVFPLVDIIETKLALENNYEGNPLVIWCISNLPNGYGWNLFILIHLIMSALAFCLGWIGKSEENIGPRVTLALLDVFCVFVVTINALLMKLYGII